MRGIYTNVNDIRKRVFSEVARLSYEYKEDMDLEQMRQIPYNVIPGILSSLRGQSFVNVSDWLWVLKFRVMTDIFP